MKEKERNIANARRVFLGEAAPSDMPFSLFTDTC